MEKNLYDTSKLIELYKNGKSFKGYTTILNVIEFPKALELDITILYPLKISFS